MKLLWWQGHWDCSCYYWWWRWRWWLRRWCNYSSNYNSIKVCEWLIILRTANYYTNWRLLNLIHSSVKYVKKNNKKTVACRWDVELSPVMNLFLSILLQNDVSRRPVNILLSFVFVWTSNGKLMRKCHNFLGRNSPTTNFPQHAQKENIMQIHQASVRSISIERALG